ncbi:MAG: hypothetical protein Tsb0013_15990 [Phycisphaerales bacterium]
MDRYLTGAACALMLLAGNASAQLVFNEIAEDPFGEDDSNEFIELYGCPNMPLDGYLIALVKGGSDANGDDVLDSAADAPEIDECVALDGFMTDENGFFVVTFDQPTVGAIFPYPLNPNPGFMGLIDTYNDRKWLNGAAAYMMHVNNPDNPDPLGNLQSENSSTYLLIRRRPFDTRLSPPGVAPVQFAAGHRWAKDYDIDKDFDGKIDFGNETTAAPQGGVAWSNLKPFQIVDQVAFSNNGGKEYVSTSQNEISDTPSFNPDNLTRLSYLLDNPLAGHRTKDDGVGGFTIEDTRKADEEWIYGESISGAVDNPFGAGTYTGQLFDTSLGFLPSELNRPMSKGPTDQNATGYNGSCDPEPDSGPLPLPNNGCTPTGGPFLFDDIDVTGMPVTPGAFNDHPTNTSIRQFRWLDADLDFDNDVDADDLAIANTFLGATLDDQEMGVLSDNGTPMDPMDDITGMVWTWQAGEFQQLLALLKLVDDGPAVTQADIDVIRTIVNPNDCVADFDNDGDVDLGDFGVFGGAFGSMIGDANYNADADFDSDGDVDLGDFGVFGGEFGRNDCFN